MNIFGAFLISEINWFENGSFLIISKILEHRFSMEQHTTDGMKLRRFKSKVFSSARAIKYNDVEFLSTLK